MISICYYYRSQLFNIQNIIKKDYIKALVDSSDPMAGMMLGNVFKASLCVIVSIIINGPHYSLSNYLEISISF